MKSFARFRLGSHFLRVETERFGSAPPAWVDRICSRCSPEYLFSLECGADDEYHLFFDCEAVSGIREENDLSECESV